MIRTENFEIDGEQFVRTWSDSGYYIEAADGGRHEWYEVAEDPEGSGRTYTETETKIVYEWKAGSCYTAGDVVTYDGARWLCLLSGTTAAPGDDDTWAGVR